jgi:pimeloyl-ACP methyl ester carboxylesterase
VRRAAALLAIAALAALLGAGRTAPPVLDRVEVGAGEPRIVLVHGIGADRGEWDAVARQLAQKHRVLLVDLPGHGRSPALDSVRVAWVADALERTLRGAGVERALLVGHSYGGLVVLDLASRSKLAQGAVVVDIGAYARIDPQQLASAEQLLTERYSAFIPTVFRMMSADSSGQDWLVASAAAVPRPVLTAYFRDAWHADLRPQVKKLRVPLLVAATPALWPEGQPWDSVRVRLGYGKAKKAEGVRIVDSAHFVPIDQPDSLAAAIEAFAQRLR